MTLRGRLTRLEHRHAPVPVCAHVMQRGEGGPVCVTVAGEHFGSYEAYRHRYPPDRIMSERWVILDRRDDEHPPAPSSLAGCCVRAAGAKEGA